jgi:hypothetical protein
MGEVREEDRDRWGAFVAGMFESCPTDWPPEQAWTRVMERLRALMNPEPIPSLEDLRRWAAAWATANLPPDILLRRRWF